MKAMSDTIDRPAHRRSTVTDVVERFDKHYAELDAVLCRLGAEIDELEARLGPVLNAAPGPMRGETVAAALREPTDTGSPLAGALESRLDTLAAMIARLDGRVEAVHDLTRRVEL